MKLTGIREKVFLDRYSIKNKKGDSVEKTPNEMWRRVARAVAQQEPLERSDNAAAIIAWGYLTDADP